MRRHNMPDDFPMYRQTADGSLLAFLGPMEMFKIHNIGSNNGNEGITIDKYRTRKMVLKHVESGFEISMHTFRERYRYAFEAILQIMT